jgi:hypothetical protein
MANISKSKGAKARADRNSKARGRTAKTDVQKAAPNKGRRVRAGAVLDRPGSREKR